jgi:hypothetical protein
MKKNINPDQRIDAPVFSQQASTLRDRKKILSLLREKPTHTIQFREQHGLISPAPRIKELRSKGFVISTTPIRAKSLDGRWHNNIALYELLAEPQSMLLESEVAA